MNLVLATVDDLKAQAGSVTVAKLDALDDADLGRVMRFSQNTVLRATRAARYATDNDGLALDENIRSALRDATVAQALALIEADLHTTITTGGAGAAPKVTSTSDNGASLQFDTSAADGATARLAGGGLSTEAELILSGQALLTGYPMIYM